MIKEITFRMFLCLYVFFAGNISAFPWPDEKARIGNTKQYSSSLFEKEDFFTNKKTESSWQEEYFQETGKDGEEIAYAPPPGIDDGSTPQKMLPLEVSIKILLSVFSLGGTYILICKRKEKYVLI